MSDIDDDKKSAHGDESCDDCYPEENFTRLHEKLQEMIFVNDQTVQGELQKPAEERDHDYVIGATTLSAKLQVAVDALEEFGLVDYDEHGFSDGTFPMHKPESATEKSN